MFVRNIFQEIIMQKKQTTKQCGRPTKITAVIIAKITEYLMEDNYFEVACAACGITRQTGYNWLERGEKESQRIDSGEIPYESETLHLEFFYAVEKAQAMAEVEDIRYIRGGFPDWQAKAWIRERKNFERWGKKESHEVTGKDGKPIEVEVDVKSKLISAINRLATRGEKTQDIAGS